MAYYTVQEFITRAQAGGSVKVINSITASGQNTLTLHIGNQPFDVGFNCVDLGAYFTAEDTLKSYELRAMLVKKYVLATSGLISLSLTPTSA